MTETISFATTESKRNDVLKLIAIITMIIDHIGAAFFPEVTLFRTIGRIAFPIFAYQLAKGYRHTSNLGEYSKRLLIFACISYIPYIYFLGDGTTPNPLALNVMFLLLAGIGALLLYDTAHTYFYRYKKSKAIGQLILGILTFIALIAYVLLPELLVVTVPGFMFSYGTYGLLMMLSFYVYEEQALPLLFSFALITLGTTYLKGVRYMVRGVPMSMMSTIYFNTLIERSSDVMDNIFGYKDGLKTLSGYFFQARSIMGYGLIILFCKKNYSFTLNKYIAYWFYPVHISIILIISYFMYYN